MFENLNFWEIGALLLLALFIFGPERLPKVIGDGLRMLRGMREMARNATRDLSREMGTDISLEDLHPKTFIRKHLISEEDEAQMRRPFEDAYQDVKQITSDANDGWSADSSTSRPHDQGAGGKPGENGYGENGSGRYGDQATGGGPGDPGSTAYGDQRSGGYEQRPSGYPAGPYDASSGGHGQPRNIDSDAT
jgi:sec-independent protein translocase protein TatB